MRDPTGGAEVLRVDGAHEEGGEILYSVSTKEFTGENGVVKKLKGVKIEWVPQPGGPPKMQEIAGSEFELPADLVLLAMGYARLSLRLQEHWGALAGALLGMARIAVPSVMLVLLAARLLPGLWETALERPQGSLFVWAPIPEPYAEMSSLEFATMCVQEGKVAVSPGSGFGPGGEGFVRFALVENEQRITQAIRQLRRGLTKLG